MRNKKNFLKINSETQRAHYEMPHVLVGNFEASTKISPRELS